MRKQPCGAAKMNTKEKNQIFFLALGPGMHKHFALLFAFLLSILLSLGSSKVLKTLSATKNAMFHCIFLKLKEVVV
jgi:hypothetical protein